MDSRNEHKSDPPEHPHRPGTHEIKLGRIEALVDAVFGFAMTLLVLNLVIDRGLSGTELNTALVAQVDNILVYFLSFIILGNFWVIFNWQYTHMRGSDTVHVWITIFMLMFVALMPFSTLVLADYYDTTQAELFFATDVLFLGLFMAASWYYSTLDRRLVEPGLDHVTIERGLQRSLLYPVVGVVVIGVAFFAPLICPLIYLLVPLSQFLPVFRRSTT